jgi:hypothetical protein
MAIAGTSGHVMARRLPIIVVIALTIIGLVIADHASTRSVVSDTVGTGALMPVASPPQAVSSAFFCAGGGATPGKTFDTVLVIANPNASPISVLVTTYPAALSSDAAGVAAVAALKPVTKPVAVGARTRTELAVHDLLQAPFAAAVVETNDPDVGVERRVYANGVPMGSSPCASAPSDAWYFPTGTTTRDAQELLAVFNPFAVDAVIDVTLQTSDGFRNPGELRSLPVPGGQMRVVDLSTLVPRIEQLAATVVSRSGRVIVDRLQSFDGSDPNHPSGVAATLGVPVPANVWAFGEGQVADGLSEVFTLMNPSDQPANAQLEVTLDDPATNGSVDPIPVTIPARGYAQVVMGDQTRVPANVAHSVIVRSAAVSIVAERTIRGVAPAPRHGYAPAMGVPLVATRWLFADGRAFANNTAEVLVVVNPSPDAIAHVRFNALAQGQLLAIDGLQDVEVAAAGRLSVDLGQHVNRIDLPVMVESDVPVAVERGIYAADGTTISLAGGIPLAETASKPPTTLPTTTATTAPPG